jgi:hypothetical protein
LITLHDSVKQKIKMRTSGKFLADNFNETVSITMDVERYRLEVNVFHQ